MKTSAIAAILFLFLTILSCKDDEEERPSVIGKWQGTLAEVEVHPFGIPLPISEKDENFNTQLEFRSDATLLISNNSQPAEGSWQVVDDKLITDINFSTDFIELSGSYTIEELTQSVLVISIEKENQTITIPDTGQTVSGDVIVTLHFEKI